MIGGIIRAKAEELGMRRKDVAAFLGVSHATLISWVRGDTEPKERFQPKIYEFFALEPQKPADEGQEPQNSMPRKTEKREAQRLLRKSRAEEFAALYRDGKTLEQIGVIYGITRERVRQLLAEFGITRSDGGITVLALRAREARLAALDAKYLKRFGIHRADYLAIPAKARLAYSQQRRNASSRNIAWQMSISEWWGVWQDSGKWSKRGRGDGYCMGRKGDCGPYSVENVYICTVAENFSHSYIWKPAHMRKDRGREIYEHAGKSLPLSLWAREVGIAAPTLRARINYGWPLARVLSEPIAINNSHLKRLSGQAGGEQ